MKKKEKVENNKITMENVVNETKEVSTEEVAEANIVNNDVEIENKVKEKPIKPAKEKKYVTFESRVILRAGICAVSFIMMLIFIIFSLKFNVDTNLRYYQTSNLDYRVNLKNNEFYTEQSLGQNMQYIASLIDTVDLNFLYNFRVSEQLNYSYSYNITAEVQIKDSQSGNIIFSKKDKLKEKNNVSMMNSNSFSLRENLELNYGKYNDIAKKFKSEYAISADSSLLVSMYITVKDQNGNEITSKNLNANNKMNVIVPLAEQTVNIKLDYKEINNSDTFVAHTNLVIHNKTLFYTGIACGVIFLVALAVLLKFMSVLIKKKTPYDKELARILREYDRIIVATKKVYETDDQEMIEVKSFSELLDARDNLEKPILFSELHKGAKSVFIVKNSYEVYKYVLKAVDLEKK